MQWPTPKGRDWKGMSQRGLHAPMGALPNAVAKFPTPVASGKLNGGTRDFARLQELKDAGQITEEERRSMSAGNGGKLNPDWVDLLMGYPKGWTRGGKAGRMARRESQTDAKAAWTALDALETPSSRKSRSGSGVE
jgi:hypothetical protein